MRSENMSKSLLTAYHITKMLFPLGNRGHWTRLWRQSLDRK